MRVVCSGSPGDFLGQSSISPYISWFELPFYLTIAWYIRVIYISYNTSAAPNRCSWRLTSHCQARLTSHSVSDVTVRLWRHTLRCRPVVGSGRPPVVTFPRALGQAAPSPPPAPPPPPPGCVSGICDDFRDPVLHARPTLHSAGG